MKKIATCLILALILMSSLVVLPAKATSVLWSVIWGQEHNYEEEGNLQKRASETSIVGGTASVDIALAVSVYQYGWEYEDRCVRFRVAVYVDSLCEFAHFVTSWAVVVYIEKTTHRDGGGLENHRINWDRATEATPQYSQGRGFEQGSTTSIVDALFSYPTLLTAVCMIAEPPLAVSIATELIALGVSSLPEPSNLDDASASENIASSHWTRNSGYNKTETEDGFEARQFCLNSVRWLQDKDVNPSSYFGIKVWARVYFAIAEPLPLDPDEPWVDTPPVYLRINHNYPPNTPSKPSGTTYGYVGTSYSYSTSTTDPNGDSLRYQFYWGDGSYTLTGWYTSDATASASHSWSSTGYKYVKVRAQDSSGAWSGWSPSFTVYISSGGGGCPILSVWDGTDYFEEGLLDIHNPEGVDVVYEHTLVSTPQRENGAYLLRLTEHPQTHSYIDQVKLYAILEDGTIIELPLIYAWHSEGGNVLPQLLHSDEWKTDTLGADHNNGTSQSIDLKFASLSPNLEIVGFVFQIEGNNRIVKMLK